MAAALAFACIAACPVVVEAGARSLFSTFRHLSANDLKTLQCKLTYVGPRAKAPPSLAIVAKRRTPEMGLFRPFQRSGEFEYSSSKTLVVEASIRELANLIDSVATLPSVTAGVVDSAWSASFALSVTRSDTLGVFESIVGEENGILLLQRMLGALAGNDAATEAVAGFACALAWPLGPTPADVSGLVSISVGSFRKEVVAHHYATRVRITNSSSQAIAGPLIYVVRVSDNITPLTSARRTCRIWPPGAMYVELPIGSSLRPGRHVDLMLRVDNPDEEPIELDFQRVLAGPGFH